MHPAELYRSARAHVFSTYTKRGYASALKLLSQKYAKELSRNCHVGLQAELYFYHAERERLDLVPALDCGDATDFSGIIDRQHARIDVTTNPKFKSLLNYEKYAHKGDPYYIAVYDMKYREVLLLDINFPFCKQCGGCLFPIIVFQKSLSLRIGGPTFSLELWEVCSRFPGEHHREMTASLVIEPGTPSKVPHQLQEMILDDFMMQTRLTKEEIYKYNMIATFLKKDFESQVTLIAKRYWVPDGGELIQSANVHVIWAQYIVSDFISRGKTLQLFRGKAVQGNQENIDSIAY